MTKQLLFPERVAWMMGIMAIAGVALTLRVAYIQGPARAKYLSLTAIHPDRGAELRGERGAILDRTYRVLAESVLATTVAVAPNEIQEWATRNADSKAEALKAGPLLENSRMQQAARAISACLDMPYGDVLERLCRKKAKYVVLKARADADRAQIVEELGGIPGLQLEPTERREYPFDGLASAVIGYCDAEQTPKSGVERWFRQVTEGQRVAVGAYYDANGRRVLSRHMGGRPRPGAGKDLVLTIDVALQQAVEKALDACVAAR